MVNFDWGLWHGTGRIAPAPSSGDSSQQPPIQQPATANHKHVTPHNTTKHKDAHTETHAFTHHHHKPCC